VSKRVVLALVAVALPLLAAAAPARPTGFPEPAFPAGREQRSLIVEEVQYHFAVREYTPAVLVKPVAREKAAYDTPEAAAISFLSAKMAGDREWWEGSFTAGARARAIASAPPAAAWADEQRRSFAGMQVLLTHRVVTGPYVAINQVIDVPPTPGALPTSFKHGPNMIVLAYEGGRWLVTDALADDPVMVYWARPGAHVRTIGRVIGPGPLAGAAAGPASGKPD
jgi:hypothetical protein